MRKQQGFSFFSLAFILAMIAAAVSIALKIIPPYMDFLTFSGATLETLKQPRMGMQTNDIIRKKIDTQMSINNIHLHDFDADALSLARQDGVMVAEIDYTKEEMVFESENFQIALSLHFNKTHEVKLDSE